MTGDEILWEGRESRSLTLQRPCECGCDYRGGVRGVGYLIGSDKDGHGVTIWIKSEATFMRLLKVMQDNK